MILQGSEWTIFHEQLMDARREALNKLRLDSERSVDFYHGVQKPYMDAYFEQIFTNWSDNKGKIPLTTFNFTKAIINGLSKLYKEGTQRNIYIGDNEDEAATELYNSIIRDAMKPSWMKTVDRMTRLVKTVLVHPYWDYDKGMLSYRIFTPDLCDVKQSPYNPQKLTAVVYKLSAIDTANNIGGYEGEAKTDYYVYWDNENTYWIDEWGQRIQNPDNPEAINPYKILTFATFRDSMPIGNQFWGDIDETIIGVNMDINAMATDLKHLARMQCFSQAVAIGDFGGDIATDPMSVIVLPTGANGDSQFQAGQPDFKFVTPNPKLEEVKSLIDFWQSVAYSIEKMSPQSITAQSHIASGFSIMAANLPLLEDRQDRAQLFEAWEKDLYQTEKAVYNYHAKIEGLPQLPENSELRINWPDLTFPMSKDEKIKYDEHRLKNNLISFGELLMEYDSNILNEDEAVEKIKANKELNELFKAVAGTGLFERNIE